MRFTDNLGLHKLVNDVVLASRRRCGSNSSSNVGGWHLPVKKRNDRVHFCVWSHGDKILSNSGCSPLSASSFNDNIGLHFQKLYYKALSLSSMSFSTLTRPIVSRPLHSLTTPVSRSFQIEIHADIFRSLPWHPSHAPCISNRFQCVRNPNTLQ